MKHPMSGEQSRRPGAGARSPGRGRVPPGDRQGPGVRLGRPANDNRPPLGKRLRRLLLPGLLIAGLWAVYRFF